MVLVSSVQAQLSGPVNVAGVDTYTVSGTVVGAVCPTVTGSPVAIVGATTIAADNVLVDFQCLYGSIGMGGSLHLENVRLATATLGSVDGYALYTKSTLVTMDNVEIDGYSGASGQTGGGAMRIRSAVYTGQTSLYPTLNNVRVTNCCRGFRIQDSTNVYIKDCTATDVTDNAFYFASGSYTSSAGCTDSTFDSCTATNAGQTAFMNIGGTGNSFLNIVVDGSRGAGFYNWNSNGITTVSGATFTNANSDWTETPWGGNTDDANGAAIGQSVEAGDTSAELVVTNSIVNSGGVAGGGAAPQDGPASIVFYNAGPGTITVNLPFSYNLSNFPGGYTNSANVGALPTDAPTNNPTSYPTVSGQILVTPENEVLETGTCTTPLTYAQCADLQQDPAFASTTAFFGPNNYANSPPGCVFNSAVNNFYHNNGPNGDYTGITADCSSDNKCYCGLDHSIPTTDPFILICQETINNWWSSNNNYPFNNCHNYGCEPIGGATDLATCQANCQAGNVHDGTHPLLDQGNACSGGSCITKCRDICSEGCGKYYITNNPSNSPTNNPSNSPTTNPTTSLPTTSPTSLPTTEEYYARNPFDLKINSIFLLLFNSDITTMRRQLTAGTSSAIQTELETAIADATGVDVSQVLVYEVSAEEESPGEYSTVIAFGYQDISEDEEESIVSILSDRTAISSAITTSIQDAPTIGTLFIMPITYNLKSPSVATLVCTLAGICFDDSDNDGVPDYIEGFNTDSDGDGVLDYLDIDDDNDSILTSSEHGGDGFNPVDCNTDGVPDYRDPDDDGDGVLTIIEINGDENSPTDSSSLIDTDGDGNPDKCDPDDDGDGLLTIFEADGSPADGYLKHIEQLSCSRGGTIVDDSLCSAAVQVKRRRAQSCVDYDQAACEAACSALNPTPYGRTFTFVSAGSYTTKGCYAYDFNSGNYGGRCYYGTGGSSAQNQAALTYPKVRPVGHDCGTYPVETDNCIGAVSGTSYLENQYSFGFDGECGSGELRMYDGYDNLNTGTYNEIVENCYQACWSKANKSPTEDATTDWVNSVAYDWTFNDANPSHSPGNPHPSGGFMVNTRWGNSARGRCYCETGDSLTCIEDTSSSTPYQRFDYDMCTKSPTVSPTGAPTVAPTTSAPTTPPPTSSPTVSPICCEYSMVDSDSDGIPNYLDSDDDGDGILTIAETGGLVADGYIKHIEQRSCSTGGSIVDNSLCLATVETKRIL